MSVERSLPLKGIKILDFTQVQFGPMATQVLADFGADVIKVERPKTGDISRSIDVRSEGIEDSAPFLSLNRNKRSIVLDMKNPQALSVVYKLLEDVDVIVSNFRAGVAQRMGLGYEDLKEKFPWLIFASGTGYGESGPLKEMGGQDMALQSIAGAAWHNRDANGRPQIYPISFIDFGAGMAIVQGILLAIIERAVSGQGQRVDVSLIDTAMFEQMQEYTSWLLRRFEIHWERDNLVGAFKTSDGWVTIVGLFRPDPLRAVCEALDIDDLTKRPEFATNSQVQRNRVELWGILDQQISYFTTEQAVEKLSSAGVLCGPVLDYDEVLKHPQVKHNNVVRAVRHAELGDVKVIDNPIRLSESDRRRFFAPPPLLGQNTGEILREVGYSTAEIAALERNGVVEISS